jgi:hypothetical protein
MFIFVILYNRIHSFLSQWCYCGGYSCQFNGSFEIRFHSKSSIRIRFQGYNLRGEKINLSNYLNNANNKRFHDYNPKRKQNAFRNGNIIFFLHDKATLESGYQSCLNSESTKFYLKYSCDGGCYPSYPIPSQPSHGSQMNWTSISSSNTTKMVLERVNTL